MFIVCCGCCLNIALVSLLFCCLSVDGIVEIHRPLVVVHVFPPYYKYCNGNDKDEQNDDANHRRRDDCLLIVLLLVILGTNIGVRIPGPVR